MEACFECGRLVTEVAEVPARDNGEPTTVLVCPECIDKEEDPRERDDDDGSSYGDPRDEMDDRRGW